jgi:hypothetical protein
MALKLLMLSECNRVIDAGTAVDSSVCVVIAELLLQIIEVFDNLRILGRHLEGILCLRRCLRAT